MAATHRALIAGTGRAGTSFLVRWLGACGVPAGDLEELAFHDRARAGLERNLRHDTETYLVKDPFLSEYVHTVDLGATTIDALIVPVRDLRRAALSRVRQERAQLAADGGVQSRRQHTGSVPGGVVYSLSVTDQERVLATGQAKLIEWALAHSVPLYLLHYPRLTTDGAYAVDALSPWLLQFCTRDEALARFAELARPSEWLTEISEADPDQDPERVADLLVEIEALHVALDEQRRRATEVEARYTEELHHREAQLEGVLTSGSYRLARRIASLTRPWRRRARPGG